MHDPLIPFEPVFSPQGPTLLVAVRQSEVIRETPRHHHSCGQLIGAIRGLLTVDGGDCRWVVPATHAVWIPPGVPHGLCSPVHIQDGVFMFLPKPVASYLISHLFSQ
ncbi:AraC family ligand binding domain-containing protein [Klebsiella pneumoniae]